MVKFALELSCNVDQINELYTCGPDYQWNLKLQCRTCNEIDNTWHGISENEKVQGRSGPGSFNFQMKCKFCSNVYTIDIVPDSVKRLKSNENDKIKGQIVVFDCRGVEPVEFDPQSGWLARSEETGSVFEDVDFSEEPNWAGYDERGATPVAIDELTARFIRV